MKDRQKVEAIFVRQFFSLILADDFAGFTREPRHANLGLQPPASCKKQYKLIVFGTTLRHILAIDGRERR